MHIVDIEAIKTNLEELEIYLRHIPKDVLLLIISHYHIGRRSTDVKSTMITNMVQHFKRLLTPDVCQGGCGSSVVKPMTTCGKCVEKPIRKNEKRHEFMEKLDTLVSELKPMRNRVVDIDRFNKDQLSLIARKLEISFEQTCPKAKLFDKINEVLEKRERDHLRLQFAQEKTVVPLVMNGLTIQARGTDGYINATMLCQAGNKRFFNWYRLDTTKAFMETLSHETHIPVSQLLDVKRGHSSHFEQGSWVHPDLAVQLAQWISPEFALRVSRWVRELVTTGEAHRDQEKTSDQLIALQMELQKNQEELKKLKEKHKYLLQRRDYYKFEKGTCFYIVRMKEDTDFFKVGYEGTDVNMRFRTYRTGNPTMRVCYIVYAADAYLLEQTLLKRFQSKKVEQNHEVLTDMALEDLVQSAQTYLDFCHMEHHVVPSDSIDRYNQS
jgi:hypothetical protein